MQEKGDCLGYEYLLLSHVTTAACICIIWTMCTAHFFNFQHTECKTKQFGDRKCIAPLKIILVGLKSPCNQGDSSKSWLKFFIQASHQRAKFLNAMHNQGTEFMYFSHTPCWIICKIWVISLIYKTTHTYSSKRQLTRDCKKYHSMNIQVHACFREW